MGNKPRFPSDTPLGHIWPTGRDITVIFTQCCNDEQKKLKILDQARKVADERQQVDVSLTPAGEAIR